MLIETLTTFPDIYDSYMGSSIMKRAQDKGILEFKTYNLRDWTHDFHMTTDDKPYGGGPGQLMMCEPIFDAYKDIIKKSNSKPHVILLSPVGKTFNDQHCNRLLNFDRLLFICGHYEGIDQRVYTLADDVFSIGDYVLSSGELASTVIIDSVVRKLPGVLGGQNSTIDESFTDGLLEYPQYTRPSEYEGMRVPEVLLSGNHKKIKEWRRQQSLIRTFKYRPDLLEKANLSNEDIEFIEQLKTIR